MAAQNNALACVLHIGAPWTWCTAKCKFGLLAIQCCTTLVGSYPSHGVNQLKVIDRKLSATGKLGTAFMTPLPVA